MMSILLNTSINDYDNAEESMQILSSDSFTFRLLMEYLCQPERSLTNEMFILLEKLCDSIEENVKVILSAFSDVSVSSDDECNTNLTNQAADPNGSAKNMCYINAEARSAEPSEADNDIALIAGSPTV